MEEDITISPSSPLTIPWVKVGIVRRRGKGRGERRLTSLPSLHHWMPLQNPQSNLEGAAVVGRESAMLTHTSEKHADSRTPSSWHQENITILKVSRNIASFADLASRVSDCGIAKHRGDLGLISRGLMHKSDEETTFALEVEVSSILKLLLESITLSVQHK